MITLTLSIACTTFLKEYFITILMENAFPESKTQNTADIYTAPSIHIHQSPAARLIVFTTKGNNEIARTTIQVHHDLIELQFKLYFFFSPQVTEETWQFRKVK